MRLLKKIQVCQENSISLEIKAKAHAHIAPVVMLSSANSFQSSVPSAVCEHRTCRCAGILITGLIDSELGYINARLDTTHT